MTTPPKNPDALAALIRGYCGSAFDQPATQVTVKLSKDDYFLIREALSQKPSGGDAILSYIAKHGFNWRGYCMHVVERGGTGDISDLQSFIATLPQEKAALTPSPSQGCKYNRRECFADSIDGLMAFIHYGELLSAGVDQGLDHTNSNGEIDGSSPSPRSKTPAPDYVMVPRELMQDLWTKAQEVGYHAEMDVLKGKRRGHWIKPVAYEMIELLNPYKADDAPEREG